MSIKKINIIIIAQFITTKIWKQFRCPSTDKRIKKIWQTYTVLSSHKEEQNVVICRKMVGSRGHHVEQNWPDSERQTLNVLPSMWNLKKMT